MSGVDAAVAIDPVSPLRWQGDTSFVCMLASQERDDEGPASEDADPSHLSPVAPGDTTPLPVVDVATADSP